MATMDAFPSARGFSRPGHRLDHRGRRRLERHHRLRIRARRRQDSTRPPASARSSAARPTPAISPSSPPPCWSWPWWWLASTALSGKNSRPSPTTAAASASDPHVQSDSQPLIELRHVSHEYGTTARPRGRTRPLRHQPEHLRKRSRRPARAVGLRQVHPRAHHGRPDHADPGRGALEGHAAHRRLAGRRRWSFRISRSFPG